MADLIRTFRLLNAEQRTAAVGAVLLAVSTFGPFSFVEAAELLIAFGVLALLRARALGKRFHLPFGDGPVIAGAGAWAAALIVVRLFDRPLGQNLLALVCAAILVLAGLRMRLRRPMDDLPQERERARGEEFVGSGGAAAGQVQFAFARAAGSGSGSGSGSGAGDTAETAALPRSEEATEPLPPGGERPSGVKRQTPAARRLPPPDPPTAVRPSSPPPAAERLDPDFDLPAPKEAQPPPPPPKEPPPPPSADEGPFRARPADAPPRRPPDR